MEPVSLPKHLPCRLLLFVCFRIVPILPWELEFVGEGREGKAMKQGAVFPRTTFFGFYLDVTGLISLVTW